MNRIICLDGSGPASRETNVARLRAVPGLFAARYKGDAEGIMSVAGPGEPALRILPPLSDLGLLPVGFSGHEALSELFAFQIDLLAENGTDVAFERLLGQPATVCLGLADGRKRYFNGICSGVGQGEQGEIFTAYRLDVVPQLWLLTRKSQSRIFQQVSIPEILKQVLSGLNVSYDLRGEYHPRDYCVQYRETDFHFTSRLMEEEGIFYFFQHSANGHRLVVADTPQGHPDLPAPTRLIYDTSEGGNREEDRVHGWKKVQELRSGKYTLWDHSFELPHKHLEAEKAIQDSVSVGRVRHKLNVSNNSKLEIYDYPGDYAQRFDGVYPGGGDRPGDIQRIFEDNKRTAEIRMQQEALPGLVISGSSNCRHLSSGHCFTLERHSNADGGYILTGVRHSASYRDAYRTGSGRSFSYENTFTCIPVDLPFRPARKAVKPVVPGPQTAVVVGPPGEEIFTDKYGRVKVQFHWDRQGRNDGNSSCWVRVGSIWAGKQWGAIHIPRVGQEVIVGFQEGDPDQPLIIGSVYNADQMPPYALPENRTQSGVKSRSSQGGSPDNFNELRFEDKKGSEDVYFQAEKDFHRYVKHDDDLKVDHDQTITVKNDRTEVVEQGNEKVTIRKGDRTITVTTGDDTHTISQGNRSVEIAMGNDALTIKMGNQSTKLSMGNQSTKLDLGSSSTEALQSIELKVGQSSVKLDQTGVTISGMTISIEGQIQTSVKGAITQINGDGMLQLKGGITMIN